ncbi:MAG: hypothetical protein JWO38_7500 [Gemmataceae bacterium]|nr:hypothetical protein [Gemmataceae bacterium]
MAHTKIGQQPPRYSFLLNQYPDVRLSKCPRCNQPTHMRKFALFVHIEGWGPLALGKTCRYCAGCELIIAHQDELEAELAHGLSPLAPEVVGNEYVVLGTLDRRVWERGLGEQGQPLGDALEHLADFKKVLELEVDPGGWGPADR